MEPDQITDRPAGAADPAVTAGAPARKARPSPSHAQTSARPRRKMRWWLPALIVLLAGGAVAYAQFNDDLDQASRNVFTMAPCAAAGLLLAAWLVFCTGLSWWVKGAVAALAVAAPAAFFTFYGLEFSGDMRVKPVPRAWWAGTPEAALPNISNITRAGGTAVTVRPDDFAQFMGPERLGVVRGAHLERDWSAHPPREIWRKKVGLGWGSFAVAGPFLSREMRASAGLGLGCGTFTVPGQIAVTQEQRGGDELVVAYGGDDGEVLWAHAHPTRFSEAMGGDGPRATPTLSGGKVFALGATGILDCIDAGTGEPDWSHDTLKENGNAKNLQWGKACSPLVIEDLGLVVVSLGEGGDGALAAYDAKSGKLKWVGGDGNEDKASYSSPMLLTLGGMKQIVSINANTVTGHDPADGKALWRYHWDDNKAPAKASQPVPLSGDRLLLLAGYGVTGVVLQVKHDGREWATEEVYRTNHLRTKFTTAVVRDHFAYGLDDGALACIDLAQEAKTMWEVGKRPGPDRVGHGQVLLVDDLLIVQAEEPGDVLLVEANPDGFHKLGVIHAFTEKTWNNPALAGRRLFVRNNHEAACYELPVTGGDK
jgi:outer membrane protein assembly factor BamB